MEEVTVSCRCGRAMRVDALRGRGAYRCGCGVAIKIEVPLGMANDDSKCAVRFGVRQCSRPRLERLSVCATCLTTFATQALRMPVLRRELAEAEGYREYAEHVNATREAKFAEVRASHIATLRAREERVPINVVYYVRIRPGHIKIGMTGQLWARMKAYRIMDDSDVLAAEPGGYKMETSRHQQFAEYRIGEQREDYSEAEELMDHIAAVREQHGRPYELVASLLAQRKSATVRSA